MATHKNRKRLLKLTLCAFVGLVVLVVFAAFVITRPAFIKAVVIPKVSDAVGTPVEVGALSFSPLSKVELRDVRVGTEGNPLLRAGTVRIRYGLGKILGGEIAIDEILVDSAVVTLTQGADGSWNVPVAKDVTPEAEDTSDDAGKPGSSKTPRIRLESVALRNTSVRVVTSDATDQDLNVEVTAIDFALPDLSNGSPFEARFGAQLASLKSGQAQIQGGTVTGILEGELSDDLMPSRLAATIDVTGLAGSAGATRLDDRSLHVAVELAASGNGYELTQLQLIEKAGDRVDAEVSVSGTLTPDPLTADLDIEIGPITPEALNVLGATVGDYDFGRTSVSYRGKATLAPDGLLSSEGRLVVGDLTVSSEELGVPAFEPMDVVVEHDVSFNQRTQTVNIRKASCQSDMLALKLSDPLRLELSAEDPFADVQSRVSAALRDFPLAWANPFLPKGEGATKVESGQLRADVVCRISEGGKLITSTGSIAATNVAVTAGGKRFGDLGVDVAIDASITEARHLSLKQLGVRIVSNGRDAGEVTLSGKLDVHELAGNFECRLRQVDQDLIGVLPPDALGGTKVQSAALNGTLGLTLADKARTMAFSGDIDIADIMTVIPGRPQRESFRVSLQAEGAQAADQIRFDSFDVALHTPGRRLLQASLRATVATGGQPDPIRFRLTSAGIDGGRLAELFPADDGPDVAGGALPPRLPEPAEAPKEPAPVDLQDLRVDGSFDLRNISYGDILISSCVGKAVVAGNEVRIKPLDLVVNDAPFHLESVVDLGVEGYRYELACALKSFDFQPCVTTFAPKLTDHVRGGVKELSISGKGQGITLPSLAKNLRGTLTLDPDRLGLTEISWLNEAAAIFKLRELGDLSFDAGMVELDASDGKVGIRQLKLEGSSLRLSASGSTGLDQNLDVDIRFGVRFGSSLMDSLREMGVLSAARDDGREFFDWPTALPVGGTWSSPQVDLQKFWSKSLLALGVQGAVGALRNVEGVGEGTVTGAGKVVGGFTDVITGKKKASEATGGILEGALNIGVDVMQQREEKKRREEEEERGQTAKTAEQGEPGKLGKAPETDPQTTKPKDDREQRRDAIEELGGSLLKGLLGQPKPAPKDEKDAAATDPKQAQPETQAPERTPAKETTAQTGAKPKTKTKDVVPEEDEDDRRRRQRREALEGLGGSLLKGLLAPRK